MDCDHLRACLAGLAGSGDAPAGGTAASVLVVVHGKIPSVIMTRKSRSLRQHAGEISFPGGKRDAADSDLMETALRETREEIGLSVAKSQVICRLDPVRTAGSGYVISPFVAVLDDLGGRRLEPNSEVDEIFDVPLGPLLSSAGPDPLSRGPPGAKAFVFGQNTVWGASARILEQVARRTGQ